MSDRILGAVCVVAAAGMAWAAKDYAAAISYEPVGPKAFPLLLAGLLAVAGAWLVIKPAGHGEPLGWAQVKVLLPGAAAMVVYALLFETLGFTVATTLMAVPVGMAFGGTWKQSLAGGAGLGVALYLLFDKLLDVVLPSGLLSFVLGGR
ncbi:MAG TPA: tripartite tricarboxylate transporter TctB family protein [Rubrivivax sp.]|nr:tripartite tricarboxylate transporter TctB family protein [Rubrivivax sp.]